jgi:hypothetical protein
MSLITSKDNIYVFVDNKKYQDKDVKSLFGFMDESFTIYFKIKVIKDLLTDDLSYAFSRNGKHSGISFRKHYDDILVVFNYWFVDKNGDDVYFEKNYKLNNDIELDFNDYAMICDDENKTIKCYVNHTNIGTIEYDGLEKEKYSNSFIWIGCGNLLTDHEEHKHIGNFLFDMMIGLDISVSYNKISYIATDYEKYIEPRFELDEKFLKKDLPFYGNTIFFMDFKHKSVYKLWNLRFNGINPQLYIENNIYY